METHNADTTVDPVFPLYIDEFVPHPGGHFDEAVLIEVITKFGGEKIKVAPNAPVKPRTLTGNEADWLKLHKLPAGQLCGMFDDKEPGTGKRQEGTCSALKAAKIVGVDQMVELDRLLRAVNRVDNTATATGSDMSTLMKNFINGSPEAMHSAVFGWVGTGIRAVIEYLLVVERTDYVHPSFVLESMITEKEIEDPRIIERMRKMMAGSEKQIGNCIQLAGIARAMKIIGVADKDVFDWLHTGLIYCAVQQQYYIDAIEEVRQNRRVYSLRSHVNGEITEGVIIHSDNPQIANACRSPEFQYAVTIVRRSTGNVAILPNNADQSDKIARWALLRMKETPFEKRHLATWSSYTDTGNHPLVPHWHMMKNGAALNGTRFMKATPCILTDDELVDIEQMSRTGEAYQEFKRLRMEAVSRQIAAPLQGPSYIPREERLELEKVFDAANF